MRSFATLKNLEDFLVPIVLTFVLLPYIYVMALYMTYEELFVRLKIRLQEDRLLMRFGQWQVVRACLFRLSSVKRFASDYVNRVGPATTRSEFELLVAEFRAAK